MMKMKAAVARELNKLGVETVTLAPPKADEVLVRGARGGRLPFRSAHVAR